MVNKGDVDSFELIKSENEGNKYKISFMKTVWRNAKQNQFRLEKRYV